MSREESVKRCSKCGVTKPFDAFRRNRRSRDDALQDCGVRGILCDGCNGGLGAFNDDPTYLTMCRRIPKQPGTQRRKGYLLQALPQLLHARDSDRLYGGHDNFLRIRRYGIDKAALRQLIEEQGGQCAICQEAPAVHLDYDHLTGKIRGVLCFSCNRGFGKFGDSPLVLWRAAGYFTGVQ